MQASWVADHSLTFTAICGSAMLISTRLCSDTLLNPASARCPYIQLYLCDNYNVCVCGWLLVITNSNRQYHPT
jgi:hypothetical protein